MDTSNNEQTYFASGQTIEPIEASGLRYIDALFNNEYNIPIRWVSDSYLTPQYSENESTVITYSFPGLDGTTAYFNYTDDVGEIVSTPFTSQQAIDIRIALEEVSKYINVTFIEVNEIDTKVGTLRFAINTITDEAGNYLPGIAATADPPDSEARGGDIWFNRGSEELDFSKGLVYETSHFPPVSILYHEVFHTLGLEHPGDHELIDFDEEKNYVNYTVMATGDSFSEEPLNDLGGDSGVEIHPAPNPMVYDIAPLQHLYGANMTYNIDDTVYSFDPETPSIETIWDAGGIDTLNFSNFSKNNTISLVDGSYSSIPFTNWSLTDNLGIAYGAIIENVISGSGNDSITGNSVNNRIEGGAGDNIINGGEGIDTVIYNEALSLFTITNSSVYLAFSIRGSGNNVDNLTGIERLQFSDIICSVDVDGNAGIAAKVIIATFGSGSLGSYMSAALSVVDGGTSLESLCALVVDLSLIENEIGSSTNGSFVDHVYENVVGIAPSSTDHDTYTALLDNETYTKSSLLALAANTTLTANLVTANSIDLIGVPGSADGEMLAIQYDLGLV